MIVRIFIQVVVLAILVGLTVAPIGLGALGSGSAVPTVAAQTISADQCHGDEAMSFTPPSPAVDQEMLVVVTSATTHRGVYLAASERATAVQETEGQLGRVWLWSLTPKWSGSHHFQFFVDFSILCAEATVNVGPPPLGAPISLPPGAPGLPSTVGVAPGQPPILPIDDTSNSNEDDDNDNESDNDNDDDCDDDNSNDSNGNDSSGNDNCDDSNDNVATPSAPGIDSLLCTDSSTHEITINGRRFGEPQSQFSGQVLFVKEDSTQTFDASTVLSWKSERIVLLVPSNVTTADEYTVYLVTLGGFAKRPLPNACRHDV